MANVTEPLKKGSKRVSFQWKMRALRRSNASDTLARPRGQRSGQASFLAGFKAD